VIINALLLAALPQLAGWTQHGALSGHSGRGAEGLMWFFSVANPMLRTQ
jgi:hypothetical protein